MVERPSKGGGKVIDGLHTIHGALYVVEISQVSLNGFYPLIPIELMGAAGVAGKHEAADLVSLLEQPFDEVCSNSARPPP